MYPHEPLVSQPLPQLLLDKGVISDDQLRIALQEQQRNQQPISRLLVGLGFLSEATIRDILSETLAQSSIDLSQMIADPAALALIPQQLARRYLLFPLFVNQTEQTLTLALSDPHNLIALDQVQAHLPSGWHVQSQLASESDISCAIDRYYGVELSIEGILREIEPEARLVAPSIQPSEQQHPVIRLIDAIFNEAVQSNASDIHFEPESHFLRIRYRIDGVLHQVRSIHKSYWPAMVVRLKVMANMNIAETRAPQDGRLSLRLSGRPIDFRLASHPTTHGENMVLRILDQQKGIVPLSQLELDETALSQLHQLMACPEGVLLVTGPTGSGKTTTLYSMLNHLNTEAVNIMTLEDPVEYPKALMRQTSINESNKLDFANGVRSIMRQDPDIILIGEIRDQATAEMAFRAAMTGHQVYSTLHSNSALGAFSRLQDLGVNPALLHGNINGIIAQRLIRSLCPYCKQAYQPDTSTTLPSPLQLDTTLYRAQGCEHCHFSGYRGRRAIMELLIISPELDELLDQPRALRQAAFEQGYRPLAQQALQQVELGHTSLAEAQRVVNLHRWH